MHGGRFNPKGTPALYVALDPMTAIKEAAQGFARKFEPCVLCTYEIDCEDVVDLRGEKHAQRSGRRRRGDGLPLVRGGGRRARAASWRLARRLIADGAAGVLAPSFVRGATPGDVNLILWDWSGRRPHKVAVFDPERPPAEEPALVGMRPVGRACHPGRVVKHGAPNKPSREWSPLMAFWLDIAAFALKALLIVAALGGLALLIARLARSGEAKDQEIKVRSLNERYDDMRDALNAALLDKKERKALMKARKKEAKAAARARRDQEPGKRIYVLSFKGDMRAGAVKELGAEIDAVLTVARPETDEAVIRIESGGGTVTGYGLAAAEILRLRERKINVTASVDQVAASGGYMMACAANRIVAAPFALVGSIGVVAPVPNLHRLLKKNEIDFEEMTAGEWKRSVSILGEITPAGREHFRGKLDATHEAFKAHVAQCRPNVDIAKVANGDVWLGSEALALGLVDQLTTGDELLFRARGEARLYEVSTEARKTLVQQLLGGLGFAAQRAADFIAAKLRAL